MTVLNENAAKVCVPIDDVFFPLPATHFTVLWENVSLQEKNVTDSFTFQATLCKNGDIIFVYKTVPNIMNEITEDYHPLKIGLSDAYILDRVIYCKSIKQIAYLVSCLSILKRAYVPVTGNAFEVSRTMLVFNNDFR